MAPIKYEKLVLVGAFCKIGGVDTGKPVQISGVFWKSEVFPGF